jgi:alpha-tubulin suppressor-like RCC1 family protein
MLLRSVLSQRFASLAAGTFHCAALEDTGQVWVWGANSEGQLGVGDLAQRAQPARVIFLEGVNVVRVATGAYHTLFLTDFGELFSTGLNANGQLGHGDDVSRRLPSQVH